MNINSTITDTTHKDFQILDAQWNKELRGVAPDPDGTYTQANLMEKDFALLLYDEDKPIACGSLRDKGAGTYELKRVFLQKDYRGKGLGRSLLQGILTWAKENAVQRIILETGDVLQAANVLYRSLGFQRIPNYPPYVHLPESICMELVLNKA